MLHAYVRCSTVEQNPQLQIDAVERIGADRIWVEQRSAVAYRPELARLLYSMRKGDVLVVWKLDRLARSLADLLGILARLDALGVSVRSVTEPIDTGTPVGRMLTQLLGSFSEFERSMIRERCAAGIVAARSRGVRFGRTPYLDRERMAKLLGSGMSHSAVACELGCHQATVSRLVAKGEVHQPPSMKRRRGSHT